MAFYSDCPSCVTGIHDGHVEHWGKRPEGVIDGDFCACTGDCAERAKAAFDKAWGGVVGQGGTGQTPGPDYDAGSCPTARRSHTSQPPSLRSSLT